MSMKIYNGIKFRAHTAKSLFEDIDILRKTTKQFLQDQLKIILTPDKLSRRHEIARLFSDPINTFSVVIFHHNNIFYGMLFLQTIIDNPRNEAESYLLQTKTFLKDLYELNIFDEYHYWDNTDKPNELSVAEWDERRKVWNAIFSKNGIPTEAGLIAELTPTFLLS